MRVRTCGKLQHVCKKWSWQRTSKKGPVMLFWRQIRFLLQSFEPQKWYYVLMLIFAINYNCCYNYYIPLRFSTVNPPSFPFWVNTISQPDTRPETSPLVGKESWGAIVVWRISHVFRHEKATASNQSTLDLMSQILEGDLVEGDGPSCNGDGSWYFVHG